MPARTVSCLSLRTKAFRTHQNASYSQPNMGLISGKASKDKLSLSQTPSHLGLVTLSANSGSGEAGVRPVLIVAGDCRSLSVRIFPLVQDSPSGSILIVFPGPRGIPDGNPEAIIVGSPLDGTKNAATALGNIYGDITGVITFQCGLQHRIPHRLLTLAQIRLLLCSTLHSSENNHLPQFFCTSFNHQTLK